MLPPFPPRSGTHLLHDEYSARHPYADRQGDFLPVPEGDPILRRQGYLVRADPGDLILWDSRTIHCNSPAIHPPSDAPTGVDVPKPSELLRLVGYVCCTPRAWCTPAVMKHRAKAALELTTSTHWPHAFVPTGYRPPWMPPRKPSDYSRDEVRLILGDGGRWPGEKADKAERMGAEKDEPKARKPSATAAPMKPAAAAAPAASGPRRSLAESYAAPTAKGKSGSASRGAVTDGPPKRATGAAGKVRTPAHLADAKPSGGGGGGIAGLFGGGGPAGALRLGGSASGSGGTAAARRPMVERRAGSPLNLSSDALRRGGSGGGSRGLITRLYRSTMTSPRGGSSRSAVAPGPPTVHT